jgi:mono/diheme cytochrome c family protein
MGIKFIRRLGFIPYLLATMLPAAAQEFGEGAMDRGKTVPFQGGEAIFKGICQGCHMPDAKGVIGAGSYPSLDRDKKLETASYPLAVIVHGQKAMPALGGMMDDKQIADVVNYIRNNFGNKYKIPVSPSDVSVVR